MNSKPKQSKGSPMQGLAAAIVTAVCTGCAAPYAVVDPPSNEFARLTAADGSDVATRPSELDPQIEKDMRHE